MKIMAKNIALLIFFLPALLAPAYPASPSAEYLCEIGISFYRLGRYEEALTEFNKALIVEPDNQTAKNYISSIFTPKAENPARGGYARSRAQAKKEKTMDDALNKLKITGEVRISAGITSDDIIWKQANGDLNERNFRVLSEAAYNKRSNTYDPAIYDRLKLNLDTQNEEGFNFHSNITVDPWSFTGKTKKITIGSAASDIAEIELKYWSNTRYTINETVFTLDDGASVSVPEIKVVDGKTPATPVSTTFGANLTIPELKIEREFQPVRELWFDYKQDGADIRFFPIAYQNQALTSDDPLRLSNNHIWWEESPWLDRWLPGRVNPGATPDDFTRGKLDDALSFFTRDSDLTRLTALRGFSVNLGSLSDTTINATVASPKGLWQDYDSFDNIAAAARIKHNLSDNFSVGNIYTYRIGINEAEGNKKDFTNHVIGIDTGYEIREGVKLSAEAAQSFTKRDFTAPVDFNSRSRGNSYYFSVISRYPHKPIMGLEHGYDEIKPDKDEGLFMKMRAFAAHMDEEFDPSLSTYRETRDDSFWSRHLHFKKPFDYYYEGLYKPALAWDDIAPARIGNGIDTGRDVLGLRVENSLCNNQLENLFDLRNVHNTNGKYIETVGRNETTWALNPKLTAKLLGIYHDLPKTKGGTDPFIFDPDTNLFFANAAIPDGKDPTLKTGSAGLEYALTDTLSLNGSWERTNDYTLAYDNYPRGNLNSSSFATFTEYSKVYRREAPFLYSQTLFPLPPYPFYNIFRAGLRIEPIESLQLYLNYTRNEFKSAGQIDDNMNHIGFEAAYLPTKKLGLYARYVYSRWNDLTLMQQGYSKIYLAHHNFFTEFRYLPCETDELIMQYGESGRSPIGQISTDPFGGALLTLDTQHIVRLLYRKKF